MKVVTVIGARPQFIKAASVSAAFLQLGVEELIIHTGQHYDENMSNIFFEELGIPKPYANLGIGGGGHGEMTGAQLAGIEKILLAEQPDFLLVYGDTNSTLAGALAAAKLHIPVAHVEAGLRSFNRRMPEEINRVLTDHASSLLFAPTDIAISHLANEGIPAEACHQVGDVMYDASKFFSDKALSRSRILSELGLTKGGFVLSTIHRAENTNDLQRLTVILQALAVVAESIPVVLPIHPRTRHVIVQHGLDELIANKVTLIDPVGYLDMVMLEMSAAVIATDSGGVQKEAFFFSVPCVTMRDETEWVELVASGWNKLVSPVDARQLAEAILGSVGNQGAAIAPYGDGTASIKIVKKMLEYIKG
ncbi:UDP-N-acetylglucosamine 2-epimerase (non-hydrolyzing) [Vogesella sp. DC21W]|uniref:UDP-N-acetylglucosamine 2-epimerase (Non-hydrolyzing) n=1 Tax=Vogesella aquatica TaxID=2984206 RepID=A0ABT5IZB2_9NEIS|nr:UDP-N-acetylglucosamine 2-epimerase (non-hydrolyzing) [Vogesella aquatica]MDC7717898.1 UDP-N-acetylglucosamine 2-epimerase (non-hydrolyzing) [Vogesella aquatica]